MNKAVLFDIDDTLFPSTYFSSLSRRNAITAIINAGAEIPRERIEEVLSKIISEKGSNYGRHFDELCERLGIEDKSKTVAYAVAAYHNTKQSIHPFPGVRRCLVEVLKSCPIFVATEGIAVKQWDKLIRLGVADLFDGAFISEELGIEKSREFYERISLSLDIPAENIVMVGDHPEKDIAFARDAGMLTVRVRKGKRAKLDSNAHITINQTMDLLRALSEFGFLER